MKVDERLKELIARNAALPFLKENIAEDTDLVNDLALDSMAIVNLFADLEEAFRIEIDVRELSPAVLHRYGRFREFVQVAIAPKAVAADKENR